MKIFKSLTAMAGLVAIVMTLQGNGCFGGNDGVGDVGGVEGGIETAGRDGDGRGELMSKPAVGERPLTRNELEEYIDKDAPRTTWDQAGMVILDHDACQRLVIEAAVERLRDEFGGTEEEWLSILEKDASPRPARVPHRPRTEISR